MNNSTAVISSSFYYSINMLKLLTEMKIITKEEAENTIETLAEHYDITYIFYS